jgi:hypothetical protein
MCALIRVLRDGGNTSAFGLQPKYLGSYKSHWIDLDGGCGGFSVGFESMIRSVRQEKRR